MPKLILKFDDEPLKTFEMSEPSITIGRLPENAVSIVNMGISRRHSRIELGAGGCYTITDLNSLNGTYVNDKRITKCELSYGDKIIIGKYTILFEKGSTDPEPSSTAPLLAAKDPSEATSDTLHLITVPAATTSTVPHPATSGEDISADAPEGNPVLIETTKHVVYKLEKEITTLGSSEGDDIFLDGLFIDESHVAIERRPDGLWLVNKKLFGKVKVNGKKTKEHKLSHKDRIEIGSSTLRFMENG